MTNEDLIQARLFTDSDYRELVLHKLRLLLTARAQYAERIMFIESNGLNPLKEKHYYNDINKRIDELKIIVSRKTQIRHT